MQLMNKEEESPYYFFRGGGAMGKLIRAKDWASTPLGNPKNWPKSLQTMVSVMLENPFGMYIAWGKEYTQIYNDGYRPILGETKHPQALGISSKETFSEIWHIISSMFDGVMNGIPIGFPDFMLPLDRNGYIEKCYFDFAYSPIRLEDGKVGGVLVTVIETTNKKKAEDNLKESKNQLQFAIDATDLATWEIDPVTKCFSGDHRFNEWHGVAHQTTFDLKSNENTVQIEDWRLFLKAINNALEYSNGGELDYQYSIVNPRTKQLKIVRAKGKVLFNVYNVAEKFTGTLQNVTEEVLANRHREENERNLRLMILQAPVAIGIFRGANYTVEIANTKALELWGRSIEDVLGRPILAAMPELEAQGIKELLDDVWTTGNRFDAPELPVKLLRNNELKTVYVNFSYEPLYDSDHIINGIMAIGFDVTEQVLSRLKVEEAEERLRLATEATETATWDLDFKERTLYHSQGLAKIFGHDPFSQLNQPQLRGQIHPEDIHEVVEKAFEEALQTGVYKYDARIIKPDNTISWISTHGKLFYDAHQQPLKIIGTVRDITEEKKNQQAVLESEIKFRLLADSMPQHIWTADAKGQLNYFNQSVFDYSGLTADELQIGGWLQILHPDDRERNLKKWTESLSSGNDFLIEHRFRMFSGEYRWQLSRAIPQKDGEGNITMWVGTSTDIQEQKMFANELEKQVSERTSEIRQQNIALEKMNKELESFAYISSHDLQEPLRKIQTFASQILEKEAHNLSTGAQDKFSRIQHASNRMQTLIQDLLAYSRTNTDVRNFEMTSLTKLVDEVREELNEELNQNKAIISITENCTLRVIPFQFHQLLLNLISNSLKFAQKDIPPHIEIKGNVLENPEHGKNYNLKDKKYCHIRFSDNGIGFDKKYSKKIFEVFQRLHGKEIYKGTGIGLAIVKKIIENHQGYIFASGEVNKGAVFDIYIPV